MPATHDSFADRASGHWRRTADGPCTASIARQGDRLVITRDGRTSSHRIAYDTALSTRIVVMGPSGIVYTLTPEFFATSEVRSFNLVITQNDTGTRETWSPCEPSSG